MTLSLLLSILLMQAIPQGGGVAGTLRGIDGTPAARVRVGVMAVPLPGRGRPTGAGTLVSQVQTGDDGRFQLEAVPPGRYYIVAGKLDAPTFYPGVREIGTAKTIQVPANATVRDINFEVPENSAPPPSSSRSLPAPAAITVTGRIVLKNKPDAPMPPYITISGTISGTATIAQNGMFNVTLSPGEQRLSEVRLPEGYTVVSVTSGGTNLLTQPINIKAGGDLIVAVDVGDIRSRYRLIAMVREDSTDRLLAGERIELVPSSGEVVRMTVNAQGMVTFPRLLQGSYILRLASESFDVPEKRVVIADSSLEVELRARKKP